MSTRIRIGHICPSCVSASGYPDQDYADCNHLEDKHCCRNIYKKFSHHDTRSCRGIKSAKGQELLRQPILCV